MTRSDDLRIADIREAGAELAMIVQRGREPFVGDPILQRAAERLLEIIGEAATALSDDVADAHEEVPWRDIRRLRVLLAHHYHRVDPQQVWSIASSDVPALLAALPQPEG